MEILNIIFYNLYHFGYDLTITINKNIIKTHKISWNNFQKIFKEKLLKLYDEYNKNKPDSKKLDFKSFKRYYYENCGS